MKRGVYRRGEEALFTGDGLTDIPCKVVEASGQNIPLVYLVKLHGDTYPRRCGSHQLGKPANAPR